VFTILEIDSRSRSKKYVANQLAVFMEKMQFYWLNTSWN